MDKKYKGQSAIEYILLVTAVIAVFIVFLAPNGDMQNKISDQINKAVDQIGTMGLNTNFNDFTVSPPGGGGGPSGNCYGIDCGSYTLASCPTSNNCCWKVKVWDDESAACAIVPEGDGSGCYTPFVDPVYGDPLSECTTFSNGTCCIDMCASENPCSASGGSCSSYNQSTCCAHEGCLLRAYYHLNSVTYSCISESQASTMCDSYNLASCCCVTEVGYSGGEVSPCTQ